MADTTHLFTAEALFKSNGEQFVRQVRAYFRQITAEARSLIATGSQAQIAGIPARFTTAQGLVAANLAAKPEGTLSDRQRGIVAGSLRGNEADYASIQKEAKGLGLRLRNLSPAAVESAYNSAAKSVQESAHRQSIAILKAREAAEKLAQAENAAAAKVKERSDREAEREESYARRRAERDAKVADRRAAAPTVAEETRGLNTRTDIAKEQATNAAYLQAKARSTLAERERTAAINRTTREEAARQGLGGGSFFQRLQAQAHAKGGFGGGAGGDVRLASEFQTGGQFLASKALVTGGFALSGALLYGTISAFKEIVREASALQRELAIVKSQFDDLGDSAGFERFAKRMVDISVETGVAANEVTRITRQLAGVFRDPATGAADFAKAASEATQAIKLSQVTGLPYQEITDSLTALSVTFGTSFTEIGDQAIGLEQRLGVLSTELIRFAADVAPVAKTFGLSFEQIIGLGAIAQQRSGVSGGALAENLNRSLPSIQKGQLELARLLAQRPETEVFTAPILDAIGAAEGGKVIEQLAQSYAKMSANQRQALGDILGGERNAKAFFAILEGGQDTLDVLGGGLGDFGGKLDARFADFQSTVEFAFQRAGRALEEFGLALFNSGLADGLKLIADAGAELAKVAALLLRLFSEFNDALGGLPVKLLAVYTTLRLITALGGGVGGLRTLIAGLSTRGATAAAAPSVGFAVPGAAASASRLPALLPTFGGQGVAAGGIKGALSGFAASVAPAVAALAVAQLTQTFVQAREEIAAARQSLNEKVAAQLKAGVSIDAILAAGGPDKPSIIDSLSFAVTGTGTPQEEKLNEIQRQNAQRQGEELNALIAASNEAEQRRLVEVFAKGQHPGGVSPSVLSGLQRAGLPALIQSFIDDPTNDEKQKGIQAILKFIAEGGGTPQQVAALLAIANRYAQATDAGASLAAANDYAPVLEEIRARYAIGDASFAQLAAAERKNVELTKSVLERATGESRLKAAREYASAISEADNVITTEAERVADLTTKIAQLRGENVTKATTGAAVGKLQLAISQGASPDVVGGFGLEVLLAQQKELEELINSPVIVDGIARAATTAEKAARALQGTPANEQARDAVVRAQVSKNLLVSVTALAKQKGQTIDATIDEVVKLILASDQAINDTLRASLETEIASIEHLIAAGGTDEGLAGERAIQFYNQQISALKAAIANLPSAVYDPGPTIKGPEQAVEAATDDAANEARALAEALISQDRARGRGDPLANAQAAIDSAKVAMQYASKPSEREAAIAQLIEAQNALDDAYNGIALAQIDLASARTSDPVERARLELQKVQNAVDRARGTEAEYNALARQAEATRTLNDAVADVFRAQHELVTAIAEAAGDTVGAAKEQLTLAQKALGDLLTRRTAGDDPGDAAIDRAKADVIRARAGVRDTDLQKRESDIDFLLQMEKITTQQAVAQFQALLQIPNLTVEQTREILLKIKQLKDELGRDLQFNLPGDIKIPTLYEVRRLSPVGTPGGPSSYQDNRQIVLFPNATISADQGQLQGTVDTIISVLDARPRNGNRPGGY